MHCFMLLFPFSSFLVMFEIVNEEKKMEMKESGKENSAAHVSIHMDYTSHNKEEQSTSFLAFSPQIFNPFLPLFFLNLKKREEGRKR